MNSRTKDDAEMKGRTLHKVIFGKCAGYKESKEQFSHYDVYRYYKDTHCFDEIKYRDFPHDVKFIKENRIENKRGYLMEVQKLQWLQLITSRYNGKAYYVNYFADGWWAIWDVTNLQLNDYEVYQEWLPAETIDERMKGKKVLKDVIYLKSETSIRFESKPELQCKLKEMK